MIGSHFYGLIVGILVVWRLAHLLYAEDGPWDVMLRLRRAAGEEFWGSLLDCFYCLSLWLALPFALLLGDGLTERLLLWPALSAGAIFLERVSAKEGNLPKVSYTEDKENDHVLRQEKDATEDGGPSPDGR
jgi:hypothetical protein